MVKISRVFGSKVPVETTMRPGSRVMVEKMEGDGVVVGSIDVPLKA